MTYTNAELAEVIRSKFIPFAFTCECKGADASCADAKSDAGAWAQFNTAERIARFIESLEG